MLARTQLRRYIRPGRYVQPFIRHKETSMSQPKSKLSRRTLFAGAGTAGALAAAATLLPGAAPETVATAQPKEPPAKGGGYQLTEHVKRYYQTTLV